MKKKEEGEEDGRRRRRRSTLAQPKTNSESAEQTRVIVCLRVCEPRTPKDPLVRTRCRWWVQAGGFAADRFFYSVFSLENLPSVSVRLSRPVGRSVVTYANRVYLLPRVTVVVCPPPKSIIRGYRFSSGPFSIKLCRWWCCCFWSGRSANQ